METAQKKCLQLEFSSTDLIASTPIAITKKLPETLTSFAFNSQQTTEKPSAIFISDNQRKQDYLSPIVKKIQLCASECTSKLPFQFSNPIYYENAFESNLSHQSEKSFDLKREETTEESCNTSDKLVCNTFATSDFSSYNITPKCCNKACLLCQTEKCAPSHENDDAPLSSIKNYGKKKSNISECISHDYETSKSKDPECKSNLNSFGDLKEFHHTFDYSVSRETSDTNCILPSITNYLSSESFSSELSVYESFTTRHNQYIRDSGALHVKDESNLKGDFLSGAESKISSELENSSTDKNCLTFSSNAIISSPLLDNKEVSGADQSCNFSKTVIISDSGMNSKTESIESENIANLAITPVINKDHEIEAATDKSYNDTGLLKAESVELNEDISNDVHPATLHSESYQALSNSEKTCSIKSGTSSSNEITWEKISFSEDYSSYINKVISYIENNDLVCGETDRGSNNQIDITSHKNTSPCNTVSFTMNTSEVNPQNTQEVLSLKEVLTENNRLADPLEASPFRESLKSADFNRNVKLSNLNDSLATSSCVCSINNEENILDITEHNLIVSKSRDNHISNPSIEISTLLDLFDFNNEVSKHILLALLGEFYRTGATQTLIVEHLKNDLLFLVTIAELKEIIRGFFRAALKGNIIERRNRRYFLKFVDEKQRETLLKMHKIKNATPSRKKSSNTELEKVQVSQEESFTMSRKRSATQIENSAKTSSEQSKVTSKSKHSMELRSPEKRKRRKLFHQ